MIADAAQTWLWGLNVAASVLLIARILQTKLFKIYPFFFAYLLTDEVQQGVRKVYEGHHDQVNAIYVAGNSLKFILVTFAVREVLWAAFERYPGLAEFLKRTSIYLATASVLVALLLAGLDPSLPWIKPNLLPHFFTFERSVYSTLLTYLLGVSVFMAWFPVRIRRDVAIYIGGLVAFFASHWAEFLLLNRFRRDSALLGAVTLTVSLVCVLFWIAAIRPREEDAVTVTSLRWNPVALSKLSHQLESINASLARLVRTNSK